MVAGIDAGAATTRMAVRSGAAVTMHALEEPTLVMVGGGDESPSRPRADILAEFEFRVRDLLGARPEIVVAALPDAWLDGSPGGALTAETLRSRLAEHAGLAPARLVRRSDALVASLGPGNVLLCDAGPDRLNAVICRDGRVLAEASVRFGLQPDLAESLTDAASHEHRRAALILPRAATHARYREAPVYRLRGHYVTAGRVLDCFAPVHAAVQSTLEDLVKRHADAAPDRLALTGALATFPLLRRALPDVPETILVDPDAVARGALELADRGPEPTGRALTLPIHRLRHGRLDARRVPLDALTVDTEGAPLTVEVPASAVLRLVVEVTEAGAAARPLALPLMSIPPGRYGVGLLPANAGFGTLVLRPVDGGAPVVCPLEEHAR